MPNSSRSTRRVVILGLVISLAILGFSLPRPALKAQEPAKATDKKAMREQIMTLHAEIELMEIEQGVDRQAIADLMREERAILAQIETYVVEKTKMSSEKTFTLIMSGSPEQKWSDRWESWGGDLVFVAKEMELAEADFEKYIEKMTPEETKKAEDAIVEDFANGIPKDLLEQLKALFKV